MFASMYAAYDHLPKELQQRLEGMQAEHFEPRAGGHVRAGGEGGDARGDARRAGALLRHAVE